jgi:hypothetical protein
LRKRNEGGVAILLNSFFVPKRAFLDGGLGFTFEELVQMPAREATFDLLYFSLFEDGSG